MRTQVTFPEPLRTRVLTLGDSTTIGGGGSGSSADAHYTVAALTYYVDGSAGDDDNDGTEAAPFATLTYAISRVPSELRHDVLIRIVTAGTYTCPPIDRFVYAGGQLFVYGVPYTTVLSGAASSGSTTTLVTAGLTLNAHTGQFVIATFVSGLVERRQIRDNTTTTITPTRAFTEAVAATTTFEIITPTVVLNIPVHSPNYRTRFVGPTSQHWRSLRFAHGLSLGNVRFACSGSPGFSGMHIEGNVGFFGCNTDGTVLPYSADGGRMLCGADDAFVATAPYIAGLASTTTAWAGYGWTDGAATRMAYVSVHGHVVAPGLYTEDGNTSILGGNLYGAGTSPALEVRHSAFAHLTGIAGSPAPLLASASTDGAVVASDRGYVSIAKAQIDCTGVGGASLKAKQFGGINVGHTSDITGTATTYGSHAKSGGRIMFTAGADGQEITGGTANLAVGEAATIVTAASLASEGVFIVSDDGAGNSDGSIIQRAA